MKAPLSKDERVDLPLIASVLKDALVVHIGIKTLAWAAAHHPDFWDGEDETADGPYIKVTDPLTFAHEVARTLEEESEDGSSILSRAIDAAVKEAIEQGCEGVDHD